MPSLGRVLCTLVLLVVCAAAQAGRPVAFDDLDGVGDNGDTAFVTLDLTADGRYLALGRGRELQVRDTGTGRVSHALGEGQLPRWSPSGDRLAFYSVRSGAMQLWIWNASDGVLQQLTDFEAGVDPDPTTRVVGFAIESFHYDWSPDGTRVVFASRVAFPIPEQASGAPLVLDAHTSPELTLSGVFSHPSSATGGIAESPDGRVWRYRSPKSGEMLRSRLFVADIEARTVAMLDARSGNVFHPQWSPDGRSIAFAAIDEAAADIFSASSGEIRVMDVMAGTENVVAAGDGIHHRPRWSPDGSALAYLVGRAKPDIGMVTIDGERHERSALGRDVLRYEWASDGDGLLLSYPEGAEGRLERLRFGAPALQPLASGMERHWAQAQDGTLVWLRGLRGTDVWMKRPAAEAAVRLFSSTPSGDRGDFRLGRLETIRYRTARGFDLEGVLLYPPDHRPGTRYPLIVDAYPNSHGSYWMHPMSGNQAWAAAGYLVFKPYARSPHTWSNCNDEDPGFCASGRGAQGWDVTVDDVMTGVDALIERGLADPARMCVYGHSNGGGLVSYLITRTDRFRCAVIVAPVWPNWVGAPLLSTQIWPLMADWAGVDVLADPDSYVKLSAVFRAREVRTPVLLAAGDEDGMFLLGAIEMYNALRFAGKEVTLLRYPDQAHLFEGDGLHDLWRKEMAFFGEHLNPGQTGDGSGSDR
ncbi:prolyl oligopeptidase family serine peptidase [Luteimonas sp. Y-2-2-4F]|nr:prolyl oligopeptidase family serine peptidase [Luteimonas sp. Y-2-2-4F]MCD9033161.1 prolyl oligopeptidase family serine peptidase [Luteimonas sp. Y-2-2-4F]